MSPRMPRKPTASRRLVRTATGGSTSRSRSPQAATRKFLWRRRPTACGGTCSRSRAREPTPGIQPWPSDPTTRCTWPGRSMTAAPDTSTTRAARTRGGAHRRKSHRGMPMPEFRRWRSMHGGSRIWSGTGFARERRRLASDTVPSTRSCTPPPAQRALNPAGAVAARGRVYVAWDSSGQIYLRRRDGAWRGVERIGDPPGNARPIIAAAGRSVLLMWTQQHGDEAQLRVAVVTETGAPSPRARPPWGLIAAGLLVVTYYLLAAALIWRRTRKTV